MCVLCSNHCRKKIDISANAKYIYFSCIARCSICQKKKKKKKLDPAEVLNTCFLCKTYTRTRSIQKMEPYKISPGPLTLYSRRFLNLSVTSHVRIQNFFPMGGGVRKIILLFGGRWLRCLFLVPINMWN